MVDAHSPFEPLVRGKHGSDLESEKGNLLFGRANLCFERQENSG